MRNPAILEKQYKQALSLGWVDAVLEASRKTGVRASLLLSLASRETELNPLYLKIPGDHGRGFGLTQADIGSYPAWINSGKWKIAYECFLFAGERINERLKHYKQVSSQSGLFTVKDRQGKDFSIARRPLGPNDLERVAIASYNVGGWSYYHYCKGRSADYSTTPGPSGKPDYSLDVLLRERTFAALLDKSSRVSMISDEAEAPPLERIVNGPQESFDLSNLDEGEPKPKQEPVASTVPAEAAPVVSDAAKAEVESTLDTIKAQADHAKGVLDSAQDFIASVPAILKRPDTIKSFRIFFAMYIKGVCVAGLGFYQANKFLILTGLAIALTIAVAYLGRQTLMGYLALKQEDKPKQPQL